MQKREKKREKFYDAVFRMYKTKHFEPVLFIVAGRFVECFSENVGKNIRRWIMIIFASPEKNITMDLLLHKLGFTTLYLQLNRFL